MAVYIAKEAGACRRGKGGRRTALFYMLGNGGHDEVAYSRSYTVTATSLPIGKPAAAIVRVDRQ